jgi:CRP-like cAMP-binding protein
MADTLTLIEKTVHMKSSDVFSAIPTEPLAQLAARASEVMLDRGQTLLHEGDDDLGVFIVIEGVVELRKGNDVVRVLQSGTVHGELFLQESGAHQYTVVAREDARVLNLGRNDVFDAFLEYPEFGIAIVQDLARRHHTLTERVSELEKQLALRGAPPAQSATEEITERPAQAPQLPKRRGWWRLAARLDAKTTSSDS